ncbi:MAG: SelT/SelW/SelH family protein [Armatimonadetes bacterium]|nr:SelT/SelW/SelH family protein [Armatimonadota bacterium]
MTEILLSTYKQKIASLKLVPSGGGCFEVTLNGELVFSKLKLDRFPEPAEIKKEIDKRL